MWRTLTTRQQDWLDRAVALRETQLAPNARRIDESAAFPRENMDAIRASGLFTIGVPEEIGGAGVDLVGTALVCEELARAALQRRWRSACTSTHGGRGPPWPPRSSSGVRRARHGAKLLATHANTERAPGRSSGTTSRTPRGRADGWRLTRRRASSRPPERPTPTGYVTRPSADAPLARRPCFTSPHAGRAGRSRTSGGGWGCAGSARRGWSSRDVAGAGRTPRSARMARCWTPVPALLAALRGDPRRPLSGHGPGAGRPHQGPREDPRAPEHRPAPVGKRHGPGAGGGDADACGRGARV